MAGLLGEAIHLAGAMPAQQSMFRALRPVHATDPNEGRKSVLLPADFPNSRGFRPICVLWIGRRGEGKSLCMTATAHIQMKRYIQHGVDHQIFANYWVDFADRVSPYLVDDLVQFPPWGQKANINLDEVGATFPSRRSMAGVSVNFSNFLTQIRKRDCEVNFTTQFPQVLDQQLLMQVDLFIRARAAAKDYFGRVLSVELECHDYWGQWTGNDSRKPWPPRPEYADWFLRYDRLNRMWDHYNTNQVTPPYWVANRDAIIERQGWQRDTPSLSEGDPVAEAENAPAAPANLNELIALAGNTVNVLALLRYARAYEPDLTRPQLAEVLEGQGYTVKRVGPWMATKE